MAPTLREADADDAEALAELASSAFRAAFAHLNTPEDMASYTASAFSVPTTRVELADPASTFLLADADGDLWGYAKLRRESAASCVSGEHPVELQRIYTASDRKGLGVGTALLEACISRARTEGYRTLWLGVWEHNQSSIDFYQYKGFTKVGSHDFMLGTARQTDFIMQLNLEATT